MPKGVLVATFAAYSLWTVFWTQISTQQRKKANEKDIQVSQASRPPACFPSFFSSCGNKKC